MDEAAENFCGETKINVNRLAKCTPQYLTSDVGSFVSFPFLGSQVFSHFLYLLFYMTFCTLFHILLGPKC